MPRDEAVERGGAREAPSLGDGLGQPGLQQIPAIGERWLVALLRLDHPEALLQLGHRALELARLGRLEHEGVPAQLARVLRVLAGERVHEPPGGVREPPRVVLGWIVARPLPSAAERVERRKDVEGHQYRPRLEDLAVIDVARRRQVVLELPRQPDAVVVMRMTWPARPRAPDDRLPQARHALGEAVERRAEADVLHEGQRRLRGPDAQTGRAAEAPVTARLQIAARRRNARIAAWHAGSATSWSAPTARSTRASLPRSSAGSPGTTTDRRRSIRGRADRCAWCGRSRGPIAPPRRDASRS